MTQVMENRQTGDGFLLKARESLDSAESDHAAGRYNSCANRCYYACFQAAVAALIAAGISPRGPRGQWGHDYVQASFSGQLIGRRKVYPSRLGAMYADLRQLRQDADYTPNPVSHRQSTRALRHTRDFVQSVQGEGDSM